MRVVGALLVAGAVGAMVAAWRPIDLVAAVGRHLRPTSTGDGGPNRRRRIDGGALAWVAAGAFAGILLAQGDLFVEGPSRHVPLIGTLGALAGLVGWSARRSTIRERRARRLRYELPVVCDALALHVVAGESVASAIGDLTASTDGVVPGELRTVLRRADEIGLEPALLDAARLSAHPDGRRLYELLAHAHVAGGRLADALVDLAADLRAAMERDLTTESGRAMVTTYGPVLALMIPTALLFLLYPTLIGLRSLGGSP